MIHVETDREEIITTELHPFYVEGLGFVQAGCLQEGYELVCLDGGKEVITDVRVEWLEESAEVYNFEVADYHTYYVGDGDVLVHNTCSKASTSKNPNGYSVGDVDEHRLLSPGRNRAVGAHNIASEGRVQSHHIIQDRWAEKNVLGYSRNNAPAILLETGTGKPHTSVMNSQRARRAEVGYNTSIQYEFNSSYRDLINAGVDRKTAQKAIKDAYKYFDGLGAFN